MALTADIVDVSPDPIAGSVGDLTITFSDPVENFELSDLTLTHEGGANLLTAGQTLTTTDNIVYQLGNVGGLTDSIGQYHLALSGATSGITRLSDSRPLTVTVNEAWFRSPEVSLEIDSTTLAEADGVANLTARLSEVSNRDVVVQLGFSGTATFTPEHWNVRDDFEVSSTTITVPAGSIAATEVLTVLSDPFYEMDQTVVATIASATDAVVSASSQVTATIVDDEVEPRVYWLKQGTDDAEGGEINVQGILSGHSEFEIVLNVEFGGTATEGLDYQVSRHQIVFPPFDNAEAITIVLTDDALDEPAETISATVVSTVNTTLANDDTLVLDLFDNDAPPEVSLTADSTEVGEGDQAVVITAGLSAVSGYDVVVDLAFSGAAVEGSDFSVSSNQIVIPAGQTSGVSNVAIVDDAIEEADETLIVDISSVGNAIEQGEQQLTVTITDDDAPTYVDDVAFAESNRHGTVTGDLAGTQASDNDYEVITEALYRSNTRTRLKHQWTFDVTGGASVDFHVEAHHDSTAENFRFDYSTDGASWVPLLTVTDTSDDDIAEIVAVPDTLSGTVFVRVRDTNRKKNETAQDSISIDHMFFRSTINNGPALPIVTVVATDAFATEAGVTPGELTISRTGDVSEDLVVAYTDSGTATSGADYAALSGVVTIPAGQSFVALSVVPVDDVDSEGEETLVVTLVDNADYTVGLEATGTVVIQDDEVPAGIVSRSRSERFYDGTTSGEHTDTHSTDDVYHTVTEESYDSGRRSKAKHRWTFDVASGSSVQFFVEAHHNSATEDFRFEYYVSGTGWVSMLTVTKTSDDDLKQSFALPDGVSGQVHVRIRDTVRSRGEATLDSLFIDDMYFLTTL